MIKIVHIITGLNDGGAEAVLYRLCSSDKSSDHIVISLIDEGKYGSLLKAVGTEVYCLNMSSGRVTLSGVWKLFRLLRKYKPDVVQTWMFHADLIGGLTARLSGLKNIVWGVHHTTLVKGESKYSTILTAKINAFLSRFVPRKIIYCAEKSREFQESIGFKKSKGVVLPNGYNISDFKPSEESRIQFRNELNIGYDVFVIGHVGRFSPYKDYPSLVKALSVVLEKQSNVHFVLVGNGLDYQNKDLLHFIPSEFDKNEISLLGRRHDVSSIMNGIDLFVLSSVSEAFPNVLNEAMACGTPCVTTDVGDAALIVKDTGWIVPRRDPETLATAVLKALEEKQSNQKAWLLRKEACRNRIVENFSIEKMIEGYHRVWCGN